MELAIILVLSACIGSFLNVLISRMPQNQSIVFPASHCPQCETQLKPWHNIPLLSYLFLRGRCAFCHTKIPLRYFIVEALTPLLVLFLYWVFGFSIALLKYTLLVFLLIPAVFIDIDHKLLLDKITIPGLVLGLALSIAMAPEKFYQPVLSALAGGGLLAIVAYLGLLIYKQESMGGGDIKFGAMIGAFTTTGNILFALFAAFFLAALFAVAGMLIGK
ncbi:MAG: prepilin peptidase, partial [Calditrichaeota bacterium]